MKRDNYKTKQRDILINVIKKHKKEFTVKELYDELNGEIGLTTVYRMVDKLVLENVVSKSIGKDNTTYYQYLEKCDCDNHYYLRCDKCGNIIHVDCDCINDLSNHILKKHGFITNKEHIILQGTCSNCIKK